MRLLPANLDVALFMYVSRPDLITHLEETQLFGRVQGPEADSTTLLFRRFLSETAPFNSIHLLHAVAGGETTKKTDLLRAAFSRELEAEPSFANSLWHLMCYAGKTDGGDQILLNVPKPVFGFFPLSPFMMKGGTGNGHSVLDRNAVSKRFGSFAFLDGDELFRITGMHRHGVNSFLSPSRYDSFPDLRCIFCESLFDRYYSSRLATIQLVEVPLGDLGDRYSVVVPAEVLLAFLIYLRKSFPHIELDGKLQIGTREISRAVSAYSGLFDHANLMRLLRYIENRPVMAAYKAFTSQLAAELAKQAPYFDQRTATQAATNFVRHFFAVEHSIILRALAATEESAIESCFEELGRTEYGRLLMPCDSLEAFRSKLRMEKGRVQPVIPFTFSNEIGKSELYLFWLARMAAKLEHHVLAISRQQHLSPGLALKALMIRLVEDCTQFRAGEDPASVESAVTDFVLLFFSKTYDLVEKISKKVRVLLDPSLSPDPATATYWKLYWESTAKLLSELQIELTPMVRRRIIERAIAADLEILFDLPFATELFGGVQFVDDILDAHFGTEVT